MKRGCWIRISDELLLDLLGLSGRVIEIVGVERTARGAIDLILQGQDTELPEIGEGCAYPVATLRVIELKRKVEIVKM